MLGSKVIPIWAMCPSIMLGPQSPQTTFSHLSMADVTIIMDVLQLSTPDSRLLAGRPAYITNGLDKQGLLCGTTQTVNGTFVDLRDYKYLYFTDPFRLFSSIEVDYAPSMCVQSCPGSADACQLSALPCTSNNQYR